MTKICVIGCGGIGSRHLQAIAKLQEPAEIFCVDTSSDALLRTRELIYSMNDGLRHKLQFCYNISELPPYLDIAIIATTSNIRCAVLQDLIRQSNVKNLIFEKVLFQKIDEYYIAEEIINNHGINAYVNCARRYWPLYNKLRQRLLNVANVEFSVSGSSWGLGCNSIHYIDIIAFLCGHSGLKIDITHLDRQVIESKRIGFQEITGCITGCVGNCDNFSISSYSVGNVPTTACLNSPVLKALLYPGENKAYLADADTNWKFEEYYFDTPYVSYTTKQVAEDLLKDSNCALTPYDESMSLHLPLIEQLVVYFREKGEKNICPIT